MGETPSGWVWETQQPFILDDTEEETRYPELLQILRENGVRSFCSVPAYHSATPPGRAEFRARNASPLR